MTYYLKYRPQKLEDLDQEAVRKSLQNIFKSDNFPHALLFSGPKGTGKTSAARIVAKILNCEKLSPPTAHRSPNTNIDPCNECEQCKTITRGESLDVIELDAASHRGIDDIRMIKQAVKLAPVSAKKKVYIIDEAHMLTTEAANALLKTLEEPPEHVVFILATTNPEKIIGTIRSRVTNVVFKKATIDEIANSLKHITKGEKLQITEKSLEEIAAHADGSFRDAAKLIEQISSENEKLTDENVKKYLSGSKHFEITDFLQYLSTGSTKNCLEMIEKSIEAGSTSKDLTSDILQNFRKMLLAEAGIGNKEQKLFNFKQLLQLTELFNEAYLKINNSFIEQVPLEIAVIKWGEMGKNIKGITDIKGEDGEFKIENQGSKRSSSSAGRNSESDKSALDSIKGRKAIKSINEKVKEYSGSSTSGSGNTDNKNNPEEKLRENGNDSKNKSFEGDETMEEFVAVTNGDYKEIDGQLWSKILTHLRPDHTSTEALLRAARPLGFDGNTLRLGVYYRFHKEHLETNQHRGVLERILADVMGSNIRVICILTEPPISNGSLSKQDTNNEVVLTEPNQKSAGTETLLTNNNDKDIISLAEKIFNQ